LTGIRTFIAAVRKGAESRYMPVMAACVAAVITLPALKAGFIQDDLFHRIRLVAPSQLPSELHDTGLLSPDAGTLPAALRDMHSFARTKRQADKLRESGLTPWWTAPDWRFANWRPLDSFTHWLDDPALLWLQWHWDRLGSGHYATFDVPPMGETVFTPGPFGKI